MDTYGGIEAGGTKFKCIVASDPEHILAEKTIPTSSPGKTIPEVVNFFQTIEHSKKITLSGLGLAFFGPLDLNPISTTYGWITTTPKQDWQNFDLLSTLQKEFHVPIRLETDVNAAAIGEGTWGGAKSLKNFIYITVGTGIGAGVVVDGKPITSQIHTEAGHILLQRANDDNAQSACPYHQNCVEGLASGPAMTARWRVNPASLPDSHPAWDLEAFYIAQMLHNLVLTCAPERIILGGGVMDHKGLVERVRKNFLASLNQYIASPSVLDADQFIIPPKLSDRAGSLGAIALIRNSI